MNKHIIPILTILFAGILPGCEKKSEGVVTKIITYTAIELKGRAAMSIPLNGTYSEPGYTAKDGDADMTGQVTVSGAVDPATAGVYTITYTALNSEGYATVEYRFVGVYEPGIESMNISGTYQRTTNNAVVKVSKTPEVGVYINNNPGGVSGYTDMDIYMFHYSADVVAAPEQSSKEGRFECIDGSYDASNESFVWTCVNDEYEKTPRTFVKVN